MTLKSLFTITNVLFYFLHAILCPWTHKIADFAIVASDGLFWLSIVTSLQLFCDVTRTRVTGIVTSDSSIVPVRANWCKGDIHLWITNVNINFSPPGIHGLACKENYMYYPLFRVRSWNNCVRCMYFCILILMALTLYNKRVPVFHEEGFQLSVTSLLRNAILTKLWFYISSDNFGARVKWYIIISPLAIVPLIEENCPVITHIHNFGLNTPSLYKLGQYIRLER